ncbi:MAG: hypothetical protein ACRC6I_16595, partial [Paracoccaceae bacterium]
MEAKKAEMAQRQQGEQAKLGIEQQKAAADLQMRQQENQAKLQLEAAKLELEREKLAIERERMAMDRERMTTEGTRIDREFAVKSGEMVPPSMAPAMEAVIGALAHMQAQQAEAQQALTQGMAQLAQMVSFGNQEIIAAITQPKELVRDQGGKIVGVRGVQTGDVAPVRDGRGMVN